MFVKNSALFVFLSDSKTKDACYLNKSNNFKTFLSENFCQLKKISLSSLKKFRKPSN